MAVFLKALAPLRKPRDSAAHAARDSRTRPRRPRPWIVERLKAIAGKRVSGEGHLIVESSRHRTQEMNRKDALEKLAQLLRAARHKPKPRRATKPTKGSKRRRLASKAARATVKATRGGPIDLD